MLSRLVEPSPPSPQTPSIRESVATARPACNTRNASSASWRGPPSANCRPLCHASIGPRIPIFRSPIRRQNLTAEVQDATNLKTGPLVGVRRLTHPGLLPSVAALLPLDWIVGAESNHDGKLTM